LCARPFARACSTVDEHSVCTRALSDSHKPRPALRPRLRVFSDDRPRLAVFSSLTHIARQPMQPKCSKRHFHRGGRRLIVIRGLKQLSFWSLHWDGDGGMIPLRNAFRDVAPAYSAQQHTELRAGRSQTTNNCEVIQSAHCTHSIRSGAGSDGYAHDGLLQGPAATRAVDPER
jgi:hypothetical protein